MFYHFLNQLFEITMELDGSINRLSLYTTSVHYLVWRHYRKKAGILQLSSIEERLTINR